MVVIFIHCGDGDDGDGVLPCFFNSGILVQNKVVSCLKA